MFKIYSQMLMSCHLISWISCPCAYSLPLSALPSMIIPSPWSICAHFCVFLLLFSRSVMSNFLWSRGPQHTRLPCASASHGVYSNSYPSSRWCYPTISSSVSLFPSCLQSFPASRPFPKSRLFTSGGQSIGASASASVLPMSIPGWFPLGLTGLISLVSKGLSRISSSTTIWK